MCRAEYVGIARSVAAQLLPLHRPIADPTACCQLALGACAVIGRIGWMGARVGRSLEEHVAIAIYKTPSQKHDLERWAVISRDSLRGTRVAVREMKWRCRDSPCSTSVPRANRAARRTVRVAEVDGLMSAIVR